MLLHDLLYSFLLHRQIYTSLHASLILENCISYIMYVCTFKLYVANTALPVIGCSRSFLTNMRKRERERDMFEESNVRRIIIKDIVVRNFYRYYFNFCS